MDTLSANVPAQQSALRKFLYRRRDPAWMRARVAFNVVRVVLGVALLAAIPFAGPIAWMGVVPLAWAAVSSSWIYHVQHNDQTEAAASVAK